MYLVQLNILTYPLFLFACALNYLDERRILLLLIFEKWVYIVIDDESNTKKKQKQIKYSNFFSLSFYKY